MIIYYLYIYIYIYIYTHTHIYIHIHIQVHLKKFDYREKVIFFSVSQKPNQLSLKSRLIINLYTDTFPTRPTCLLLYLLLVCVAHAHLFSEVQKLNFTKNARLGFQDGAEHDSRVASSEKTLQFFLCFICYFVVLLAGCC